MIYLRYGAGVLALGAWAVFAWYGKTSVDGFVNALSLVVGGLGMYHVMSPTDKP